VKQVSLGTLLSFLIVSGVMLSSAKAQGADTNTHRDILNSAVPLVVRGRVLEAYGRLPLSFEPNLGQTDGLVRFVSRGDGYTLFLTQTSAVLSLSEKLGPGPRDAALQSRTTSLSMELVGAKANAQISGTDELPGKSNYFIGNDPKQWHTQVPTFERVVYKGIYPGIDLVYYGKQRQMEYDFVIAPGADPNVIKLKIEGSRQVQVDRNGDLRIRIDRDGEVRLGAPIVYQEDAGKRHSLEGKWVQSGRHDFRFALGPYDRTKTLIVDPPLIYSTFLGGSRTDRATAVAVDSSGDAFITGFTASGGFVGSGNFPTTSGAFQTACGNCANANVAFITELDPTGSTLVYSTYLGGTNGDAAFGIAVDTSGNAYVVGTTFSPNFPITTGAFQTTCAGGCTSGDAFVTEINSSGSQLVFSTFLGGTGKEAGSGIALDPQGNVYVTGSTTSTAFPTHAPVQSAFAGTTDAFVTEFNSSGSALVYSTYLGGSGDDEANSIAVDSSGSAYVTGFTASTDFPTASPIQSSNAGGNDVFVTKYKPLGTALVYSTYLGGAATDSANGIALDSSNNAYVVGSTLSTAFPTLNAFQANCSSCAAGTSDAFLTKINSAGSAIAYSTFLGGSASDQANAVVVDAANNAFVVGRTSSTDFPVAYVSTTCKSCATGGHDVFITEFDQAGSALIFSIYLGGSTAQSGLGIGLNPSEQAILVGSTQSTDFPTQAPEQPTIGGGEDAFISALPAAANCNTTKLWSAGGITITATLVCNGLFLPTPAGNNQLLGFTWGDGSPFDGSGSGGGSDCAIPPGTCSFTGTHTYTTGSYTGSTTVTDAASNTITTGFSVNIPEITIQTTSLPGGAVSTQYSQTLVVSNGTSPYTWSLTSGSLPAGLVLSAAGVISGTPTGAGTASFTVQATDSSADATQQVLSIATIIVAPGITTQPQSQTINSGTTGTMSVVATGSAPLTYQWYQGSSGDTTNPISGATNSSFTTPALTTTTNYWVRVTNSAGNADSNAATITIAAVTGPACQPPTVALASASNPLAVTASSNCTDSASTIASTTIDWGDGSTSSATSASHTYASSGTYTITVTATDANSLSGSASQMITVTAPQSNPVPQGGTVQATVSLTAPTGVASLQLTFQCISANGPNGVQSLAFYHLSCNIDNQGSMASVTLTSTPTQLTVSVLTDSGTGQQQGALAYQMAPLFATFLFLPAVVLIGARTSVNGRRILGRHAVLLLLGIIMTIGWLGCGTSSSPPPPPPPQQKTPTGSYSVSVGGSGSSGGTQSTITVGFSVTAGG
jgi:PKD repeat protein